MSKEMIVSPSPHETKLALLEEGQVVEIFVEREREAGLVGSIYKGRVTRVLPGMQSAFIDIGLERDAFLYVSDFFEGLEEYEPLAPAESERKVPTPDSEVGEPPKAEEAKPPEEAGRRAKNASLSRYRPSLRSSFPNAVPEGEDARDEGALGSAAGGADVLSPAAVRLAGIHVGWSSPPRRRANPSSCRENQ
jgi:ribonuclease G